MIVSALITSTAVSATAETLSEEFTQIAPPIGEIDLDRLQEEVRDATVAITASKQSRKRKHSARGSGVVLTRDGHIVTAYHVVEGKPNITIHTAIGVPLRAMVVAVDRDWDIAILKVETNYIFKPARLGAFARFAAGKSVRVFGNHAGATITKDGELGKRKWVSWDAYERVLRVVNADVVPGDSGGGVFDATSSELVGVTVARSISYANSGFFVPVDRIFAILARYRVLPELVDAFSAYDVLGVCVQDAPLKDGILRRGVLITFVKSGGPADAAGWMPGDILFGFGDYLVRKTDDLLFCLDRESASESAPFYIYRDGRPITGTVCVAPNPAEKPGPPDVDGTPRAGQAMANDQHAFARAIGQFLGERVPSKTWLEGLQTLGSALKSLPADGTWKPRD